MALMLIMSGLISLILIFSSSYYKVCSVICNFIIVRRLRVCISMYGNSKISLTQQKYLGKDHLIEFLICVFLICAHFIPFFSGHIGKDFVRDNLQMFIITFFIWSGIFFLRKLSDSEVSYLIEANNLNSGYGGAIWYYKNYLCRILPDNFSKAAKQFKTKEGIQLPNKLYILCPKSCKVKKYIDKSDYIEYTKNFLVFKVDHGGIKDREYHISVYRIDYNGKFFYCALEYAQPLKNLRALKENGKISLSEMYAERDSFIKNLMQMLQDRENSFEVCELVEYDDENSELHDILSNLSSVQKYKRQTIE